MKQQFSVSINTTVNKKEKLDIQNGFRVYCIFEPSLGNQWKIANLVKLASLAWRELKSQEIPSNLISCFTMCFTEAVFLFGEWIFNLVWINKVFYLLQK